MPAGRSATAAVLLERVGDGLFEGHGFARAENNKAFYAIAEGFLAECLGGRAESIGDDFTGSSITVPVGSDGVPGLAEALRTHKQEVKK